MTRSGQGADRLGSGGTGTGLWAGGAAIAGLSLISLFVGVIDLDLSTVLREPLNNLDIAASRALMQVLRSLAEQHDRTIVIVLHDINYASAYADHIVTLVDGQPGPQGAPQDILTDGLIESVFGTDAKIITDGGQKIVKL